MQPPLVNIPSCAVRSSAETMTVRIFIGPSTTDLIGRKIIHKPCSPAHILLSFNTTHSPQISPTEGREYRGKTPRVDCPTFDGEGPLEWKLKCESYFRVCRIDRELWVDTAVVYFSGDAALWLQWTNSHEVAGSWEAFVKFVCETRPPARGNIPHQQLMARSR